MDNHERMAALRARRQEKLSPERRSEIARQASRARRLTYTSTNNIAKVNYVERKLLRILESDDTDRDLLLRTAMTLLAWERHRMNLITSGLAEKSANFQLLSASREAPAPEIDVTTLTNDELRAMAKGVRPERQPGSGLYNREAAELNRKMTEMPVTTRDPEGEDPDR